MIVLVVCAATFALGVYTVLTRRDVIAVLIGIELMLGSANVQLVLAGISAGADPATTEAFGLVVLVLAAATAAVGLALVVAAARTSGRTRVDELTEVKG